MFTQLTGQSAVVKRNGMFKHCDLYSYKGQLFVKYGQGFVRLNADGKSSVEGVSLDLLAYEGPLFKNKFGHLGIVQGEGHIALEAQADGTILMLEGPK